MAVDKRYETESSASAREKWSEMGEVSGAKTEVGEEQPRERRGDEERAGERKRMNESPPVDDCCPICFGRFTVPCRGPCGHWYCGDCILQYWNHGAALQPCKCPMCSQLITRLIPETSFDRCEDVEVLENIRKYNRVFVGGVYGFILKVLELPLLIKRIFREMMDPDAADNHLFKVRLFAVKFIQ
ncbi:RING-type E3 ubiquitin transferase [Sarracenia purpurea var. burkii]